MKSDVFPKTALKAAAEEARKRKIPLTQALIEKGGVTEDELGKALARYHELEYQPGPLSPDPELIKQFSPFTLRRYQVLPLSKGEVEVVVATTDPSNPLATDEIRRITRLQVRLVVVSESTLREAFSRLGGGAPEAGPGVAPVIVGAVPTEEATGAAAKLIDKFLQRSLRRGASDIHLEPLPTGAIVRERIDGILYDVEMLTSEVFHPTVSRLKLMLGMDIVEKRLAQDGRMRFEGPSGITEIRGSTLPTIHGEKLVMRLLRSAHAHPSLENLDIGEKRQEALRRLTRLSDGLILAAGPTGSGKTTTIYSMLNGMDRKTKNVITIEDPVEYEMERANQVQVNPKIGIQFLNMLPFILRQDPDIIMVGEIREEETAQMVMRAAISGHLVFSTLHAPTALATVTRLVDMGVQPHMLVASLKACISQRLLRRLCPKCKKPRPPTVKDRQALGTTTSLDVTLYDPVGCEQCHGLGYQGRFAAMEILIIGDAMAEAILTRERRTLMETARRQGFRTMREHAAERVMAGETSLEEMLARCPVGLMGSEESTQI